MSWEATCWVMDRSKHKGANLFAMLILGNSMNEEGRGAVAARAVVQRRQRISRATAARIVRRLERSGEFVCDVRGTGHTVSEWHMPGVIRDGYAASVRGVKLSPLGARIAIPGESKRAPRGLRVSPIPLVPILPTKECLDRVPTTPTESAAAAAAHTHSKNQKCPEELKEWLERNFPGLDGPGRHRLWSECVTRAPGCTVADVKRAINQKVDQAKGVRNIIGMMLATVPDLVADDLSERKAKL